MDCQKIKKLIPIYLDKELEPQESQVVKDHLADCQACQKELEAYEQSWAMLGEVEEIQPNPGFIGRFWTHLSLDQSWHEKLFGGIKESLGKRRLVPALVMACVIVVIGSFSMNNYFQAQRTGQMLASLSGDDLIMMENIELAENLDLIAEMDFFEDLDIIESLDILET